MNTIQKELQKELDTKDRFTILGLLSQRTDFVDGIFAGSIKKKVDFNVKEAEKLKFKTLQSGNISWDKDGEVIKKVTFREKEIEYLKRQVKFFSDKKDFPTESLIPALKLDLVPEEILKTLSEDVIKELLEQEDEVIEEEEEKDANN